MARPVHLQKSMIAMMLAASLVLQGVAYSERLGPRLEMPDTDIAEDYPDCSEVLNPEMPPEFQSLVSSGSEEDESDKNAEKKCVTSIEHILKDPAEEEAGFNNMQIVMPENGDGIPVLRGQVDVSKEIKPIYELGDIYQVAKGTQITMVMMDFIATGYSQQGDRFRAMVRYPLKVNDKVLIPEGTLVRGHIQGTGDPGSMKRRGSITLAFDYLQLPDGRKIEFTETYRKGDSTIKAIGRTIGGGLGGTIIGAIRGAFKGLSLGGIQGALASDGLTLMAGAGLGALGGLGTGVAGSGDHVWFDEGDEIKISLNQTLELPELIMPSDKENEIVNDQLQIKIVDYRLGSDPFKIDNQIGLELQIVNNTPHELGSFDIALMDEFGEVYHITPFAGADSFMIRIPPESKTTKTFFFAVKNPSLRHYLVVYKPHTREILTRLSLREALKGLS